MTPIILKSFWNNIYYYSDYIIFMFELEYFEQSLSYYNSRLKK